MAKQIEDLNFRLTDKGIIEIKRQLCQQKAMYESQLESCQKDHVHKTREQFLYKDYQNKLDLIIFEFKQGLPDFLQNQIRYHERKEYDKLWKNGCCDELRRDYQSVLRPLQRENKDQSQKIKEFESICRNLNYDLLVYKEKYVEDERLKCKNKSLNQENELLILKNKFYLATESMVVDILGYELQSHGYLVLGTVNSGGLGRIYKL